jgi:hypothetical protein
MLFIDKEAFIELPIRSVSDWDQEHCFEKGKTGFIEDEVTY